MIRIKIRWKCWKWRHQARQSAEWFIIHVNVEFMHQGLKPPVCSRSARGAMWAGWKGFGTLLCGWVDGGRGGDGFLRPQLRDGCCVFQRRRSGVFLCSYNMYRGGKLCDSDAGTMWCVRANARQPNCLPQSEARPKLWLYHPGNIKVCHLYHLTCFLSARMTKIFQICHSVAALAGTPKSVFFFSPGWASVCVSLHERVSCVRGESQQSRRV